MESKTFLNIILKIVFLAVFALILSKKTDIVDLVAVFNKIDLVAIIYSLLFKSVSIIFSTFVLFYCLQFFGIYINKMKIFKIYLLSYLFNNLGLGSLGGDSYKWVSIREYVISNTKSFYALAGEKFIGLSSMLSFVAISTPLFFMGDPNIFFYVFALPLSFLFSIIFVYLSMAIIKSKFFKKFAFLRFYSVGDIYLTKNAIIKIFYANFYSFFFYLSIILSFFVIYNSIDINTPFYLSFFVIPIVILINSIPISFQGLGIREISIGFIFSYLGFSFELGVTSALILLLVNIFISLVSGICYLKTKI